MKEAENIDGYITFVFTNLTVEITIAWAAVAILTAAVCLLLTKRGRMKGETGMAVFLLTVYSFFVLFVTLLDRTPEGYPMYRLDVFWTYRAARAGDLEMCAEILWNVLLFAPIGYLLAHLLPPKRKGTAVLIGFGISTAIEATQFVTRLGLLEIDDLISNTMGAAAGYLFYCLLRAVPWKAARIFIFGALCAAAAYLINGITAA